MTQPPARRSGPDAPSVAVEPGAHASAGAAATLRVHARNLADDAVGLRVALVGLEDGWSPAPVVAPAVPPDATITVELSLTPAPGAAAGDYALLVTVESVGIDGVATARTVADATLRVDGASDVVLAVEPADALGVRRKHVEVVVGNLGLATTHVDLEAAGDDVEVRLDAARVSLRPAETVRVPAVVRARRLRFVGGRVRHPYLVTATGHAAPQRAQASFTSRAVFGSTLLRATAVLAVMAVWLTALLVTLPMVADRLGQDPSSTSSAGHGQTDDQTGTGDDESDGGGAPEAGGDDGVAEDATQGGLRVSGLVSGAQPAGVTVEVVPTSSLGPSQSSAASPGAGSSAAPGKVAAARLPMAPGDEPQRLTTETNESGIWALSGLSASSRYLVTLSKPGFGTQRVIMTGAEMVAAPLEVDLAAGDGSMSGLVTGPDGSPAGGVDLTLSDGTTTITTRTSTTGAVGRWQVDGLVTPSTYLVSASAADLGTQSLLVDLPAAGASTVNLSLDAGVAAISGRVEGWNSLGRYGGLGGITITATDGTTTRTVTTLTGESAGRFLLPGLPVPGLYTVTIAGDGYSTVTRQVRLTQDGVSGWVIALTASGGTVTGTVTDDEDGGGIAGAGLTLTSSADASTVYKTMSGSDGSGSFAFTGVATGTYVLSAVAFGFQTGYAEVVVTAGKETEVAMKLTPLAGGGLVAGGSITGRVSDARNGGPLECPPPEFAPECLVRASVVATDLDGNERTIVSYAEPEDPYLLPDQDDDPGLLPGRYTVELSAPGYEPGRVTVTVPMGLEAEAATVALQPSPSLKGSVYPRVGVLPDGACVIARSTDEPGEISEPCDPEEVQCRTLTSRCALVEDGTYRMDWLEAGTYEVTVVGLSGGYLSPEPEILNLVPGEERRWDAILDRQGIISVTAVRSTGTGSVESAAGAYVRAELAGDLVVESQVGDNGFAQLTGLDPGTYSILGSETAGGEATGSATVGVGLNQEITIQLVLASAVDEVIAYVGWQQSPSVLSPLPGAEITIVGVVGYQGAIPQRDDQVFTTGDDGTVQICTTERVGCTPALPLVEDLVDVSVSATGFTDYLANGVRLSSLASVRLEPAPQRLAGTVTLSSGASPEDVRFTVLQAPPGVADVSLEADADGTVSFSDPQRPGTNAIRPGDYTIVASLEGYSSDPVEIDVPLRTTTDPVEITASWTLRQDGRLRIQPVDSVTGDPIAGAVATLYRTDGQPPIERVAATGQTVIDFGTLPASPEPPPTESVYRVEIRIAGFRVTMSPIEVEPGTTLDSDPIDVPVDRLGTITGRVVTVLGPGWYQDLPGAEVIAERDGVDFTVTSQPDGAYRVTGTREQPGLTAGDWEVTATAPDHHDVPSATDPDGTATATAVDGTVTPGIDLGLAPDLSSLLVTVQDGEDTVPGLRLELIYSDLTRVPPIDPCEVGSAGCQTDDAGTYHFPGLLPLTYTLFISGGGYMPLSTTVPIAAGETQNRLVPITAPSGSVQGQVLRTRADGSTAPVTGSDDLQVALRQAGADVGTSGVSATGGYLIEDVGGGSYTLELRERDGPGDPWVVVVGRSITVLPGQSSAIDLVMPLVTRTVVVGVTSSTGTDLAGGLVTLQGTVDGTPMTLGPQPLSRGPSGFTVTFNQVPAGTWVPAVSGPAGHHGVHRGDEIDVAGDSPSPVNGAIAVAETELRLQAAPATGADPPSQILVTAEPTGDGGPDVDVADVETTLIPGAGDTVLYLPAVGWELSAGLPGATGWVATIAPDEVSPGAARLLARITLVAPPIATTTDVTVEPDSAVVGTALTVTVAVGATDGDDADPVSGDVSLQYRPGNAGPWTNAGTSPLADGGASFSLPTAGWSPGTYTVRTVFDAPAGWEDSQDSATVTITALDDDADAADTDEETVEQEQVEPDDGGPGDADEGDD